MKIEKLINCTGCYACYSICPKSAITLMADEEGFVYPKIDKRVCIECSLCEKVCQAIKPLENHKACHESYASVNKDENVRGKSSSGGLFSVFAKQVIAEGGIVFAVKFADDFSAIHDWTDTIDNLNKFRGSKYFQSTIGDTYKQCKTFLDNGKNVLFTGTPCQIQGLKKYLKNNYDNLYTIDVICHGVPNNRLWQVYLDYLCKINNFDRNKLSSVSFRSKIGGWKNFSLALTFEDGEVYYEPQTKSKWMLAFNKNIMMRNSCYQCPAKGCNIISDITIGDLWGIDKYLTSFDDKGTSIMYINSNKGNELVKKISAELDYKSINYNALKYNTQLIKSVSFNKNRTSFINTVFTQGFDYAYNRYVKDKFHIVIYKYLRHIGGIVLRKIGILK